MWEIYRAIIRRCFVAASLLALLQCSLVAAQESCFSGSDEEAREKIAGDDKAKNTYMLGIGMVLEPVDVRFFGNGLVCGLNPHAGIRFEGRNDAAGELSLTFLEAKPGLRKEDYGADSGDDFKELIRQLHYIGSLFRLKPRVTAKRRLTPSLILWEGRIRDSAGSELDFYLKRTRDKIDAPTPPEDNSKCGDGGCVPLKVTAVIRANSVAAFSQDIKQLPVSRVERDGNGCGSRERGEICFIVTTWPLEEYNVARSLSRKSYVRSAHRTQAGAGADADSLFLDSDLLLMAKSERLDLPVAIKILHGALQEYFKTTGLHVPDPSFSRNSLFWNLKGRKAQFERNPKPSPSDRSEWWKVRLQIAVTETAARYVLMVGMPETRVFSWALDSVPNDENFKIELTNDERFLDLRGRIMVAITKSVPISKELP